MPSRNVFLDLGVAHFEAPPFLILSGDVHPSPIQVRSALDHRARASGQTSRPGILVGVRVGLQMEKGTSW